MARVVFRDRNGRFVSPSQGKRQHIRAVFVDDNFREIASTPFRKQTKRDWERTKKRIRKGRELERLKKVNFSESLQQTFFDTVTVMQDENGKFLTAYFRDRRKPKFFDLTFQSNPLKYQQIRVPISGDFVRTIDNFFSQIGTKHFETAHDRGVRVSAKALAAPSKQSLKKIRAGSVNITLYI